ncbi:hypothetical protein DL768_005548 [Monosporascus sp. mg162]|nr:hypothetical protein DL768_005548 [Monosporascus sp. mg162]
MSTEKWKNPQLTSDMMMALYTVLGPIPGERKDDIVKFMQDRGHDITWQGIRITHCIPSILIMTKKWDDQMLARLGQIIFDVVQPQFTQEHQDAIVQRMNEKGYTVNWNAIRQADSMKWAPEVDGDILLAFRDVLTPTSEDWIKIVESLNKMGHNVTCGSLNVILTMAPTKHMVWDDSVRSDILIAMVKVIKPTPDQWAQIMNVTREMNYEFTEQALRQHLQKLKRAQEKEGGSGSAPSTPANKTRAPGKKGTTSASKRKTGPINLENLSDDNEDTPVQTPSRKKQKAAAQPANAGQLPGDEPLPPVASGKKAKKEEPATAAFGYDEPLPPFLPSSQPEWEA